MIKEKETLEKLLELSISDLIALRPYAGSHEKGWIRLLNIAIDKKVENLLVQGSPWV